MPEETTTIDQTITIDDTQTTTGAPAATEPELEATGVELNTNIVTTDNEQLPIVRLGTNSAILSTSWKKAAQNSVLLPLLENLPALKKTAIYNEQENTGVIKTKENTYTIFNFRQVQNFSVSTSQLIDAAILVFTANKLNGVVLREVEFSFDDYFSWRRMAESSKSSFRRQTKEELKILRALSIECDGNLTFKTQNESAFYRANMNDEGTIITIGFGTFFDTLNYKDTYQNYPAKLMLGVNSKENPYAYSLARKFVDLKNIKENYNQPADTYKVKTLVASCNFPSPDSETVKHNTMRLKRPFISNIASLRRDEIDNILFLNARGGKVSDDEASKMKLADFLELRVKVFWNEYPERQEPQQATSNQ